MIIVVPEVKRRANLAKHQIDMNDFEDGFSWNRYMSAPARPSRMGRARRAYLGMMGGRAVVAIVSPLGVEALAVVSIRPANAKERALYDAKD